MNYSIKKLVFLLSPMVVGLAFSMDIYVPALPRISEFFSVSAGAMQLTLTVFMLTSGLMQLLIGPLSDHFGRKPVGITMIIIFSMGTILCSFSYSILELTIFRIIQAMGACGMMVVGFATVRDVFSGNQSAEVYSFLNGIIAFSPMFAPFFGSYLDIHYGWPATFRALLIIAIAALITCFFALRETLAKEHRVPMSKMLFKQYIKIAMNPVFSIYTLATCVGLFYLYLFCSISSYIIIRILHIPEMDYGFYFCFMGISFFVGSMLSGMIVGKIGIYSTIISGFLITLVGGAIMLVWYAVNGLSIQNFVWPMLLIGLGGTFCLGAGNGGAMEPYSECAGAAAALSGAVRFLFSGLVGSILIKNNVHSTLPLSIPAILFSLIGLSIFIFYRKQLI